MRKSKIILGMNKALNDIWEAIRAIYREINDIQGDIPATVVFLYFL